MRSDPCAWRFEFDEITANIEEPSIKKKPCPTLRSDAPRIWRAFFLRMTHELLRKMHALLQNHQSLDPVTEEPKNTVLRNRVATIAGSLGVLHCRR